MEKHNKLSLLDLIKEKQSLKKLRVHSLPADEFWKIGFIKEIALIKKDHLEVHFDDNCLEEILEVLCTG